MYYGISTRGCADRHRGFAVGVSFATPQQANIFLPLKSLYQLFPASSCQVEPLLSRELVERKCATYRGSALPGVQKRPPSRCAVYRVPVAPQTRKDSLPSLQSRKDIFREGRTGDFASFDALCRGFLLRVASACPSLYGRSAEENLMSDERLREKPIRSLVAGKVMMQPRGEKRMSSGFRVIRSCVCKHFPASSLELLIFLVQRSTIRKRKTPFSRCGAGGRSSDPFGNSFEHAAAGITRLSPMGRPELSSRPVAPFPNY